MKRFFIILLGLFLVGPVWGDNKPLQEEVDLRKDMTSVKHQGRRGTCSCFASTALMEYLIFEKTGQRTDLSEAYNYWLGKFKALDSDYTKRAYKNMDGLAGYIAVSANMFGCVLESEWPYEPQNWVQTNDPRCTYENNVPTTECYTGRPPEKMKTLDFKLAPVFMKPAEIASYILNVKRPVAYNLLWVDKAVDYSTGDFRMPTAEEVKTGVGHVILLVGYSSNTKKFIFRNCWGANWGNDGYGTIPEEYVVKYSEMVMFYPLDQYSKEIREFLEKASLGVSGKLTK